MSVQIYHFFKEIPLLTCNIKLSGTNKMKLQIIINHMQIPEGGKSHQVAVA